MSWSSSDRRQHLPPDWRQRHDATLDRDPVCMACHQAPSTEADHKGHRDDHRLAVLQGLCTPCHAAKTAAQGHAARNQHPRTRPPERHPGIREVEDSTTEGATK